MFSWTQQKHHFIHPFCFSVSFKYWIHDVERDKRAVFVDSNHFAFVVVMGLCIFLFLLFGFAVLGLFIHSFFFPVVNLFRLESGQSPYESLCSKEIYGFILSHHWRISASFTSTNCTLIIWKSDKIKKGLLLLKLSIWTDMPFENILLFNDFMHVYACTYLSALPVWKSPQKSEEGIRGCSYRWLWTTTCNS